jgi:hypothetical protein
LAHDTNSGKAAFFIRCGFEVAAWQTLAANLIQHSAQHEIRNRTVTEHGVKYVIEGALTTPNGLNPQVRSVWIVDHGQIRPRLVTAYPLKGKWL